MSFGRFLTCQETQLEINKDFTTFCAIKEDGIARQWGSAIIGLLPAWYGGGAIARRANLVGTIPRLAVRSFTYTALLMVDATFSVTDDLSLLYLLLRFTTHNVSIAILGVHVSCL
jgi:hypothetical protein